MWEVGDKIADSAFRASEYRSMQPSQKVPRVSSFTLPFRNEKEPAFHTLNCCFESSVSRTTTQKGSLREAIFLKRVVKEFILQPRLQTCSLYLHYSFSVVWGRKLTEIIVRLKYCLNPSNALVLVLNLSECLPV